MVLLGSFQIAANAANLSIWSTTTLNGLPPIDSHLSTLKACQEAIEKLNARQDWENDYYCRSYGSWLDKYEEEIKAVKNLDPNYDIKVHEDNFKTWAALFDEKAYPVNQDEVDLENFQKTINDRAYKITYLINEDMASGADWVVSYFDTKNYLADAKTADYPNLLKLAVEGDVKYEHNVAYKVKKIKEFEQSYTTFFTETLKPTVNQLIDGAYKNKASNGQTAVKYITKAKELMDAALITLPENADVKALHQETKNTYNTIRESVFGNIFTSDFHKAHSGEIVFFTEKPEIKAEKPATVKNDYKAGEFIYAMAYLEGSFKDLTEATNDIMVTTTIYVNGTLSSEHAFKMGWSYLQDGKTYLFMEIVPDPATNKHRGPAKFARELALVSPRNHTVKVTLSAMQVGSSYKRDLAEGSFKLDCSTGQDQLAAYALKYREKSLAGVYMPKAAMSNSSLEASMKQALITEGWEEGKSVQKVVITSGDWTIQRDPVTNVIVSRTIGAAVAFKTDTGECKYWNLTFKQQYDGQNYGKTKLHAVGSIVELACKNVN